MAQRPISCSIIQYSQKIRTRTPREKEREYKNEDFPVFLSLGLRVYIGTHLQLAIVLYLVFPLRVSVFILSRYFLWHPGNERNSLESDHRYFFSDQTFLAKTLFSIRSKFRHAAGGIHFISQFPLFTLFLLPPTSSSHPLIFSPFHDPFHILSAAFFPSLQFLRLPASFALFLLFSSLKWPYSDFKFSDRRPSSPHLGLFFAQPFFGASQFLSLRFLCRSQLRKFCRVTISRLAFPFRYMI